jgi:hypothetical protein
MTAEQRQAFEARRNRIYNMGDVNKKKEMLHKIVYHDPPEGNPKDVDAWIKLVRLQVHN